MFVENKNKVKQCFALSGAAGIVEARAFRKAGHRAYPRFDYTPFGRSAQRERCLHFSNKSLAFEAISAI
jgi:hypothetical protein